MFSIENLENIDKEKKQAFEIVSPKEITSVEILIVSFSACTRVHTHTCMDFISDNQKKVRNIHPVFKCFLVNNNL